MYKGPGLMQFNNATRRANAASAGTSRANGASAPTGAAASGNYTPAGAAASGNYPPDGASAFNPTPAGATSANYAPAGATPTNARSNGRANGSDNKLKRREFLNCSTMIAPRHWNPLFDGPCTKGFLLDNDIIQYLKTDFLRMNPGIPADSLYILGVRYHSTTLQTSRSYLEDDFTVYDTQLGISETCKEGESPIDCLKRGLLEELHIRLNKDINPILYIPKIPSQTRSRDKYIYHFTDKTNYQLVQDRIESHPGRDTTNKIMTCIVGTIENLYPILNNYLLAPQLHENDPIIYPVLFPLKKLFEYIHYRNRSRLPPHVKFRNGLLHMTRNTELRNFVNMISEQELLFENPEDFIIPLNSPNFYQIIEKSLRQARSIKYIYKMNENPQNFTKRIDNFMKLVEFKRLKTLDEKMKFMYFHSPTVHGMGASASAFSAPGFGASTSAFSAPGFEARPPGMRASVRAPGMGASASAPRNRAAAVAAPGNGAAAVGAPGNRAAAVAAPGNRAAAVGAPGNRAAAVAAPGNRAAAVGAPGNGAAAVAAPGNRAAAVAAPGNGAATPGNGAASSRKSKIGNNRKIVNEQVLQPQPPNPKKRRSQGQGPGNN